MLRPGLLRIAMRPRIRTPATSTLLPMACQARSMHALAPLPYNIKDEATQNGISDFLSPAAFNISWTQYQTYLLQKLNVLTAETEYESHHVKDILLGTARDPGSAPIFNHASMIHNNQFFFEHISPKQVEVPEPLRSRLEQSFGSMDTLRQEMVYTAAGMFGPGFVWLVKTSQPGLPVSFKVLVTYAAGSPYPGAHWRRQENDMNTAAGGGSEAALEAGRAYLDRTAYGAGRRMGPGSATARRVAHAPGGTDLQPVLCINTWEHVWLWDYGFGVGAPDRGKLGYAEKWWKHVNWDLVQKEADLQRLEMSANMGAHAPAPMA
ncbi:Manganese/iron superoxide dismutase [Chaetomium fimeti]|uniref:Manganese/iron superoxide dismutase n=1 Tax=Chaetomium fimeti TaxID=1854472 RepID=A0AAE0HQL6_9PEZI|nr:Manganese/iron superoxide dismutase [Chaetomium fimeti]